MDRKRIFRIIFASSAVTALAAAGYLYAVEKIESLAKIPYPDDIRIEMLIPAGTTFAELAGSKGMRADEVASIIEASEKIYDLSTVAEGRKISFDFDGATRQIKQLEYFVDTQDLLTVGRNESGWTAEIKPIPYEITIEKSSGKVDSSLFEAVTAAGLDERLAIALSEVFAWQVDFAVDVQQGDTFKMVYEKRFLNGEYVMPGRILVAEFINVGKTFTGFRFAGERTDDGYYDEGGDALQKIFLKTPLQYKYISSGYTTKTRRVSRLNLAHAHRAIDYAAAAGTPSVTVGDGTVTRAGWDRYLGYSVVVKHNETYKTVYGHFKAIAKGIKAGAKVKQGQVIGYVGSTGLSTGPHLHYEMHKNGQYVNPYDIDFPSGKPVHEDDKKTFGEKVAELKALLP